MQTRQEQGTIWPEQLGMHRNRSYSEVSSVEKGEYVLLAKVK